MDRTEPHLQSSVSAWQNMITCVSMAAAAALAGAVIGRSGYPTLLTGAAVVAVIGAVAFISIDSNWLRARVPPAAKADTPLHAIVND
jgi:predicted MFS family arabinose efflux permease